MARQHRGSFTPRRSIRGKRSAKITRSGPKASLENTSADSVRHSPPLRFPQFSKLPLELRLKVWEMATDEPRVVVICDSRRPYSPTPIPSALHACAESRAVALQRYRRRLVYRYRSWPHTLSHGIWVNLARDSLYFSGRAATHLGLRYFLARIPAEDVRQIRSLGMDMTYLAAQRCDPFDADTKIGSALESVYFCLEKPGLNVRNALAYHPLHTSNHSAFVKEYRLQHGRDGRFWGMPVPAAFEKIKGEVTAKLNRKERKGYEVCFAKVAKISPTAGGRSS